MRRNSDTYQLSDSAKTDWIFEAPDSSNIGSRSTRNVSVNLTAQVIRFFLQVFSTIALARLLTPSDFGLVAMVSVFVNFVSLFKDAGLAQATVQKVKITHVQISCLFWINLTLSIGLGILIVSLAPLVAWIYDEPRLLGISAVLAIPVVVSGFSLQQRALLQRHMLFIKIVKIELISYAIGVCLGIISAYYGLGYWSLAIMPIVTSICSSFGLIVGIGWRPSLPKLGGGVRGMLSFGANITSSNFVTYLARNTDNFLIGKFLTVDALGQYSRAYGLMTLPISQINAPIGNALLPTLSRLQHNPKELSKLYLLWLKRISWLTAIPIASAFAWGESAILLLLGSDWLEAGEIFKWLAVGSFMQPIVSFGGVALISKGLSREMFKWSAFSCVVRIISFVIGVYMGSPKYVAIAYALTSLALFPLHTLYVVKSAEFNLFSYLRVFRLPLLIALGIIITSIIFSS